ncbi:MAG: PhzF family phenazine biosynthesis protein [Planctomycetota bacterium]
MAVGVFQVDAFTDRPFTGNPAAVCILPEPRDETWMQNVAREMNLSETAFLSEDRGEFELRWFTPIVEVKLCGHATLASAHILWEKGLLIPGDEARFHTHSGLLRAAQKGEWIELDFPATPDEPRSAPAGLAEALGVTPTYVGSSEFHYLVELASEEEVRKLKPDFGLLKELGLRGVIVTSVAATAGYDFVSRVFVPGAGIDEDPVTGSAHCCLGPYWRRRLGKDEFVAYQVSQRGGIVRVRVAGRRVYLAGQAVTVLCGELVECP